MTSAQEDPSSLAHDLVRDVGTIRNLVASARTRTIISNPELERADLLLLLAECHIAQLAEDLRSYADIATLTDARVGPESNVIRLVPEGRLATGAPRTPPGRG